MIKIPRWFDQEIIDEYADKIREVLGCDDIIFAEDTKGNKIKVNLRNLLTLPKKELFEKEPDAKLYFEIIKLTNYNKKKISEYCCDKKLNTYYEKRKAWINVLKQYDKRNENDKFIKQFTDDFPEYYKNNNKFDVFINAIEDMLNSNLRKYYKENTNSLYEYLSSELRHKIISSLDVNVCPYCNRQYITTYNKGDKACTTADLDHFYPKSRFPLFSLSLFNFIPSCQNCNHQKRAQFENIIYPHDEEYGNDAVFSLESSSIDSNDYDKILKSLRGIETDDINLILKIKTGSALSEKIENSKQMFNIESIYQSHLKIAKEIKYKQLIFDEGGYLSLLDGQFKELCFTQDELNIFLYGYSLRSEDDINRPLSKLVRDILNDSYL